MGDQGHSEHVCHRVKLLKSILLGSASLVAVQDESTLVRRTTHPVDILDPHDFKH